DDLRGETVMRKRKGERLADKAAARDQDITALRFGHGCRPSPPGRPWEAGRRAEPRLTPSPAHAHIAGTNCIGDRFRMASRKAATAKADWRTVFRASIARSMVIGAAAALALFTLFLTLALITHDSTDAAIHTAAGGNPSNWMGSAGAWFADLLLFVGGGPGVLRFPLLGCIAWPHWAQTPQPGGQP